jgi:hypothetical protein
MLADRRDGALIAARLARQQARLRLEGAMSIVGSRGALSVPCLLIQAVWLSGCLALVSLCLAFGPASVHSGCAVRLD